LLERLLTAGIRDYRLLKGQSHSSCALPVSVESFECLGPHTNAAGAERRINGVVSYGRTTGILELIELSD
jgi:hypothetical protein